MIYDSLMTAVRNTCNFIFYDFSKRRYMCGKPKNTKSFYLILMQTEYMVDITRTQYTEP